jgi:hypothetical protein
MGGQHFLKGAQGWLPLLIYLGPTESYLAILGRHAYLQVAARGWMLFPIAPDDSLPSQSWR